MPKTITVTKVHPAWTEEFKIRVTEKGTPVLPRCPACSMSSHRNKCAFELGGDCPRHEIYAAYVTAMRERGLKPK